MNGISVTSVYIVYSVYTFSAYIAYGVSQMKDNVASLYFESSRYPRVEFVNK